MYLSTKVFLSQNAFANVNYVSAKRAYRCVNMQLTVGNENILAGKNQSDIFFVIILLASESVFKMLILLQKDYGTSQGLKR